MNETPPPEMSEEAFNAKLAKNVAESAIHMKTLEEARRATAALRETNDAVEDLRRLREVLMEHVERTDRFAKNLLRLDEWDAVDRKVDAGLKCIKLARAVRLSIVLQQELLGLRAAPEVRLPAAQGAATQDKLAAAPVRETERLRHEPELDREPLHDRDDTRDYDHLSYDQAVGAIRAEFKIPDDAGICPAAGAKPAPDAEAGPDTPNARRKAIGGGATLANSRLVHGPPK